MPKKFEKDLLEGFRDAIDHASGGYRPGRRVAVVQVPTTEHEPAASSAASAAPDNQDRQDA